MAVESEWPEKNIYRGDTEARRKSQGFTSLVRLQQQYSPC